MAFDTKTPMALYKANLELVLRLGTLLQENRRRWTKLGVASTDDAIQKTLAQTERMLTSNDWSSLAALPGEAFWKGLQSDAGPVQGAVDAAVSNQTAFAQGLQEAFAAWQQQCADALQGAQGKLPTSATFEEFLKTFSPKPAVPAAKAKAPPPLAKPAAAARKAPQKAVKKIPKKK